VPTWVDLFLEKEVHVVGFSFDYTEYHLWNLLMKKERLSRKDDSIGKVYFHRCSDHKQNVFDEALLSILASLGTVVQNHVGSSYERAYIKFMEYVKQIIH